MLFINNTYLDLALMKCNHSSNFSIHGLWPEYTPTTYPQFCNSSNTFNISVIKPLFPQMMEDWRSCYGDTYLFWKHEWDKHGTCTDMSQFNFFNNTLFLYDSYKSMGYINKYCNQSEMECLIKVNQSMDCC